MDGNLSDCDLGLAIGNGYNCLLVDDAGWYDFGIFNFISYELGFDQVWNKGTTCNVRGGPHCSASDGF